MELKLENGNYVPANYQGFALASELDELAQRLKMKLTAKRGKFLPLPDYGSRLYLLPKTIPSQRETTARQYVIEALEDEKEVELTDFEFSQTGLSAQISATFSYRDDAKLVIPDNIEQLKSRITQIVPCHLAVEYYYIYSSWQEIMALAQTWTEAQTLCECWKKLEIVEAEG